MKSKPNKRNSKSIADEVALSIASGTIPMTADGKNLLAVMLGRLGGVKGGKARQASMTKPERIALAKKASAARWSAA